jgi:translation initiation factor 3 subunit B
VQTCFTVSFEKTINILQGRGRILFLYETNTFSLLDKKSLKIENVVDLSWSPTDPIISLFVQVDRYKKTKKSTYTGFFDLDNKNDKIAFAWEPKGHRFSVIHGDGPRPDILGSTP